MADKKSLSNFTFCFNVFIAVFDKQANICCSIGSILTLTFLHNHNATDQEIEMDRYQSYFRKRDSFFSGKQPGAVRTDQNICSLLFCDLHGGKDFQSTYISFNIFNNSTFFGTTEKRNEK